MTRQNPPEWPMRLGCLAWALLLGFLGLMVWQALSAHPESLGQSLGKARFRWLDVPLLSGPPAPSTHPDDAMVDLPHTWPSQGRQPFRTALYEVGFDWSPADVDDATQPALHIQRISGRHQIWLNGRLLHNAAPGSLTLPVGLLVQIPPTMLLPGPNRLDIEVRHDENGGMSAPLIGQWADVAPAHARWVFITQTMPVVVNVVAGTAALCMLLIWRGRRREASMGLLGLLSLVVSVRNCAYHIDPGWSLPETLSSWLFFNAQLVTAVTMGLFVLQISRRRLPWFRRALWVTALAGVPIGAVGALTDTLTPLRGVVYPALLVEVLVGLLLLLKPSNRGREVVPAGVLLGIGLSVLAAVHDYLLLRGQLPITGLQWLPMATPVALLFYGRILLDRFVLAMASIETHNSELEQRVAQRTEALAAAHSAKGHFLASASHDLRQPVAAVGMISSMLHDGLRGSPLHPLTHQLGDAVDALESLVGGLLDLARLEAGAVQVHRQRLALHDLLDRVVAQEAPTARLKGLDIRLHTACTHAFSDPLLLEQMVRNLVSNAIRYTQRGGVLVGVRQRADHLLIEVWDTGCGIAPGDQQRIFDDFVQLQGLDAMPHLTEGLNPKRVSAPRAALHQPPSGFQGLGLGLAIVRHASELLGHPVSLRSRVGRGSCFSIEVPRARRPLTSPRCSSA